MAQATNWWNSNVSAPKPKPKPVYKPSYYPPTYPQTKPKPKPAPAAAPKPKPAPVGTPHLEAGHRAQQQLEANRVANYPRIASTQQSARPRGSAATPAAVASAAGRTGRTAATQSLRQTEAGQQQLAAVTAYKEQLAETQTQAPKFEAYARQAMKPEWDRQSKEAQAEATTTDSRPAAYARANAQATARLHDQALSRQDAAAVRVQEPGSVPASTGRTPDARGRLLSTPVARPSLSRGIDLAGAVVGSGTNRFVTNLMDSVQRPTKMLPSDAPPVRPYAQNFGARITTPYERSLGLSPAELKRRHDALAMKVESASALSRGRGEGALDQYNAAMEPLSFGRQLGAGVVGDAPLLALGLAGEAPGVIGSAARGLSKAGEFLDPIGMGAEAGLRGAGRLASASVRSVADASRSPAVRDFLNTNGALGVRSGVPDRLNVGRGKPILDEAGTVIAPQSLRTHRNEATDTTPQYGNAFVPEGRVRPGEVPLAAPVVTPPSPRGTTPNQLPPMLADAGVTPGRYPTSGGAARVPGSPEAMASSLRQTTDLISGGYEGRRQANPVPNSQGVPFKVKPEVDEGDTLFQTGTSEPAQSGFFGKRDVATPRWLAEQRQALSDRMGKIRDGMQQLAELASPRTGVRVSPADRAAYRELVQEYNGINRDIFEVTETAIDKHATSPVDPLANPLTSKKMLELKGKQQALWAKIEAIKNGPATRPTRPESWKARGVRQGVENNKTQLASIENRIDEAVRPRSTALPLRAYDPSTVNPQLPAFAGGNGPGVDPATLPVPTEGLDLAGNPIPVERPGPYHLGRNAAWNSVQDSMAERRAQVRWTLDTQAHAAGQDLADDVLEAQVDAVLRTDKEFAYLRQLDTRFRNQLADPNLSWRANIDETGDPGKRVKLLDRPLTETTFTPRRNTSEWNDAFEDKIAEGTMRVGAPYENIPRRQKVPAKQPYPIMEKGLGGATTPPSTMEHYVPLDRQNDQVVTPAWVNVRGELVHDPATPGQAMFKDADDYAKVADGLDSATEQGTWDPNMEDVVWWNGESYSFREAADARFPLVEDQTGRQYVKLTTLDTGIQPAFDPQGSTAARTRAGKVTDEERAKGLSTSDLDRAAERMADDSGIFGVDEQNQYSSIPRDAFDVERLDEAAENAGRARAQQLANQDWQWMRDDNGEMMLDPVKGYPLKEQKPRRRLLDVEKDKYRNDLYEQKFSPDVHNPVTAEEQTIRDALGLPMQGLTQAPEDMRSAMYTQNDPAPLHEFTPATERPPQLEPEVPEEELDPSKTRSERDEGQRQSTMADLKIKIQVLAGQLSRPDLTAAQRRSMAGELRDSQRQLHRLGKGVSLAESRADLDLELDPFDLGDDQSLMEGEAGAPQQGLSDERSIDERVARLSQVTDHAPRRAGGRSTRPRNSLVQQPGMPPAQGRTGQFLSFLNSISSGLRGERTPIDLTNLPFRLDENGKWVPAPAGQTHRVPSGWQTLRSIDDYIGGGQGDLPPVPDWLGAEPPSRSSAGPEGTPPRPVTPSGAGTAPPRKPWGSGKPQPSANRAGSVRAPDEGVGGRPAVAPGGVYRLDPNGRSVRVDTPPAPAGPSTPPPRVIVTPAPAAAGVPSGPAPQTLAPGPFFDEVTMPPEEPAGAAPAPAPAGKPRGSLAPKPHPAPVQGASSAAPIGPPPIPAYRPQAAPPLELPGGPRPTARRSGQPMAPRPSARRTTRNTPDLSNPPFGPFPLPRGRSSGRPVAPWVQQGLPRPVPLTLQGMLPPVSPVTGSPAAQALAARFNLPQPGTTPALGPLVQPTPNSPAAQALAARMAAPKPSVRRSTRNVPSTSNPPVGPFPLPGFQTGQPLSPVTNQATPPVAPVASPMPQPGPVRPPMPPLFGGMGQPQSVAPGTPMQPKAAPLFNVQPYGNNAPNQQKPTVYQQVNGIPPTVQQGLQNQTPISPGPRRFRFPNGSGKPMNPWVRRLAWGAAGAAGTVGAIGISQLYNTLGDARQAAPFETNSFEARQGLGMPGGPGQLAADSEEGAPGIFGKLLPGNQIYNYPRAEGEFMKSIGADDSNKAARLRMRNLAETLYNDAVSTDIKKKNAQELAALVAQYPGIAPYIAYTMYGNMRYGVQDLPANIFGILPGTPGAPAAAPGVTLPPPSSGLVPDKGITQPGVATAAPAAPDAAFTDKANATYDAIFGAKGAERDRLAASLAGMIIEHPELFADDDKRAHFDKPLVGDAPQLLQWAVDYQATHQAAPGANFAEPAQLPDATVPPAVAIPPAQAPAAQAGGPPAWEDMTPTQQQTVQHASALADSMFASESGQVVVENGVEYPAWDYYEYSLASDIVQNPALFKGSEETANWAKLPNGTAMPVWDWAVSYMQQIDPSFTPATGPQAAPAPAQGSGKVQPALASPETSTRSRSFPFDDSIENVVPGGKVISVWGDDRGWRTPGATHEGIDIGAPFGTPIHARAGGTVTFAGVEGDPNSDAPLGGNFVQVRDATGHEHFYAHLQDAPTLRVGDQVSDGDVIGLVGNSGDARGQITAAHPEGEGTPHLHYQYGQGEQWEDPLPTFTTRSGGRSKVQPAPVAGVDGPPGSPTALPPRPGGQAATPVPAAPAAPAPAVALPPRPGGQPVGGPPQAAGPASGGSALPPRPIPQAQAGTPSVPKWQRPGDYEGQWTTRPTGNGTVEYVQWNGSEWLAGGMPVQEGGRTTVGGEADTAPWTKPGAYPGKTTIYYDPATNDAYEIVWNGSTWVPMPDPFDRSGETAAPTPKWAKPGAYPGETTIYYDSDTNDAYQIVWDPNEQATDGSMGAWVPMPDPFDRGASSARGGGGGGYPTRSGGGGGASYPRQSASQPQSQAPLYFSDLQEGEQNLLRQYFSLESQSARDAMLPQLAGILKRTGMTLAHLKVMADLGSQWVYRPTAPVRLRWTSS